MCIFTTWDTAAATITAEDDMGERGTEGEIYPDGRTDGQRCEQIPKLGRSLARSGGGANLRPARRRRRRPVPSALFNLTRAALRALSGSTRFTGSAAPEDETGPRLGLSELYLR